MPRVIACLLALVIVLPAQAGDKRARALHKGLMAAAENPDLPPPALLFSEEEQAKLWEGEVLFDFQHIRAHELVLAVTTSTASAQAVWDQILDVASYPDAVDLVLWARIDERFVEEDREVLTGEMELELPAVPGEMSLCAYHYPERGYLAFHLEKGKKNPFRHLVGYFTVTPYPGDKVLVSVLADVRLDYPIPMHMRASLAKMGTAYLLTELVRRAESPEFQVE